MAYIEKTWIVASSNPRPSHAEVDGETIAFQDPFSNGLFYPGDPNGDPDETAGCTCVLAIGGQAQPAGTPDEGYIGRDELDDLQRQAYEKAQSAPIPTPEDIARARARIDEIGSARYHNLTKGNSYDRARREAKLLKEFGDGESAPCVWCGKQLGPVDSGLEKLTQDHIIPASKGGKFVNDNLVPACGHCNSSRGDKDFFELLGTVRH